MLRWSLQFSLANVEVLQGLLQLYGRDSPNCSLLACSQG